MGTVTTMAGVGEIFRSFSGWLKLLELIFTFITLIIHRHGDHGHYLFFATTGLKLSNTDLVTYMVISGVLILGYVIDGREYIQESILETVWNFLGAIMFIGSGACAIITWNGQERIKTS